MVVILFECQVLVQNVHLSHRSCFPTTPVEDNSQDAIAPTSTIFSDVLFLPINGPSLLLLLLLLQDVAPAGLNTVFERFRTILHEGEIDRRVQYMIENLFAVRKVRGKGLQNITRGSATHF
jgi:hypothetical protein